MAEPSAKKSELFIWWTTEKETVEIGPHGPPCLPDYVQEMWINRYASPGYEKLFVAQRFGERVISEWPQTTIARTIREGSSAGIVVSGRDLRLFKSDVPGIVTDFKLRIMVI